MGLFGTKKSQKSIDEAEDFIAQLFEQEPDFPEEPIPAKKSTSTAQKSTAKSPKASKTSAKTSKPSKKSTSPKPSKKSKSSKVKKSAQPAVDPGFVRNYDELLAALDSHYPYITLTDNIIVTDNLLINYDVTIDFNGFGIISDESHQISRVLDIRRGVVNLLGKGKIFAMGKQGVAIRVFGAISNNSINYTNLTVDQGISLFAPDSYGILISPNLGVAHGLTINFAGQIFAHDGIGLAGAIRANDRNLPNINIIAGANIVADETTGVAIEAAGFGQWHVTDTRLSGAAAASLSAGELSFANSQAIAKDITFSLCPSEALDLKISLDGGTYVAERGANIAGEKTATTRFSIKTGNFYAPEQNIAKNLKSLVKIKGKAKFSKAVSKILAELAPESEILTQELQPIPVVDSPIDVAPPIDAVIQEQPNSASAPAESIVEPVVENSTSSTAEATSEPADEPSTNLAIEESSPTPPTELTSPTPAYSNASQAKPPTSVSTKPTPAESAEYLTGNVSNPPSEPLTPVDETLPARPATTAAQSVSTPLLQSTSILPPTPNQIFGEQEAARMALADAINDVRKLNTEEYNNYPMFEQVIRRAEAILSDPRTTLQDIFATASELLQAFDTLQQGDDFSLSDDELDELFYHGAVLEEMVNEPQDELADAVLHLQDPALLSSQSASHHASLRDSATNVSPAVVASQLSRQVQAYDDAEPAATDFSKMVDLLNLIAELDLNRYLASSQTTLLEALAESEEVLNDPTCSQEEIDDVVERITDGLQELELVRLAHLTGRSRHGQAKVSIPAPVVHQPIPIIMIDEMAPTANWSTGVTMIDEMNPFVVDADALDKMIRATKPVVTAFLDTITSPLRKVSRSLAAGTKAGLAVYRETLHAAKG